MRLVHDEHHCELAPTTDDDRPGTPAVSRPSTPTNGATMIDQYNDDRTGWARFSDDMTMRYRLARNLTSDPAPLLMARGVVYGIARVVFLMLNPSTADAFKPDPTVTECRKRATALGADVLEVVNLFALRSPYPRDLKKCAAGYRGDDATNNAEILAACTGAYRVIAAWGNDGGLGCRDLSVVGLLLRAGVALHHLGTTQDGYPKHLLARGIHRIPAGLQLAPFATPTS
jgi:hypothetical protein